jgi:DNA polymerase kappa
MILHFRYGSITRLCPRHGGAVVAVYGARQLHFTSPDLSAATTSRQTPSVGRLAFDASKAGLERVDKAHVERVIRAATANSAFCRSEQRKEAERAVRHHALVKKQRAFHRLPLAEQHVWAAKAEAVQAELEATRDFSRSFIHIDLDMFYAAVEEKYNPSLRERPFAVGSFAMLATSNYIARQYGVRSGMPGFIAKKLCPTLWIQPLHFDLYRAEATVVRSIAAAYDPHYVTVGLDELTMDVTDYLSRHSRSDSDSDALKSRRSRTISADDICAEFRARVEAATQLTCSGGISHTAAFAKIASNVHKPNGQHTVTLRTREEVLWHVRDMPVRDVPGVGSATEQQLRALGITTCKDFLTHKAELCYVFREKTFTFYLSAGLGLVRTHVDRAIAERAEQAPLTSKEAVPVVVINAPNLVKHHGSAKARRGVMATATSTPKIAPALSPPLLPLQKSTGEAVTVSRGLPSPEAFRMRLRQLVKGAHAALLQQGAGTRHVCFTTIDHSFTEHSHSSTLPRLTASYTMLLKAIADLAEPFVSRHREFRLIGVNFRKLQRVPSSSFPSSSELNGDGCDGCSDAGVMEAAEPIAVSHHYPKRRLLPPASRRCPPTSALTRSSPSTVTTRRVATVRRVPSNKKDAKLPTKPCRPTKKEKHRVAYVRYV